MIAAFGIVSDEFFAKALHHSVDDLTFTWQSEPKKYSSERLDKWLIAQVILENELGETSLVQLGIHSKELTNRGLIQVTRRLEEGDDTFDMALKIFLRIRHQLLSDQILDSILPLEIELSRSLAKFIFNDSLVLEHFEFIRSQ